MAPLKVTRAHDIDWGHKRARTCGPGHDTVKEGEPCLTAYDICRRAARDDRTEPVDDVIPDTAGPPEVGHFVDVVGWCPDEDVSAGEMPSTGVVKGASIEYTDHVPEGGDDLPPEAGVIGDHSNVEILEQHPDAGEIAAGESVMNRMLKQNEAGVKASTFRPANDTEFQMPRDEPQPYPTWLPPVGQPWKIFRGYTFVRSDPKLSTSGGSFVQNIMRERGLKTWHLGPKGLWWLIFRWFALRSRQMQALEAAAAARAAHKPYTNVLPELGYCILPQRCFAESARASIWDLRAFLAATKTERAEWQLRPVDIDDLPAHEWDTAFFEAEIKRSGFPNLDLAAQVLRRGLRINARCPHHIVLTTNYRSANHHLEVLQARYSSERTTGILDPRGPFPGPPFLPCVMITLGAAEQNGKIRPTIDPKCVRGVIELWCDSWVPQSLLDEVQQTWPAAPGPDATHEQGVVYAARCARLTRDAVLAAAADNPDGVYEPPSALPGPPSCANGRAPAGRRPWIDGMPISVNDWLDITNRQDFGIYPLPTVFQFAHDVEIFRQFGSPFGILKSDYEGWFRQLRWDPVDLWMSCWMAFADGADVDLCPNFGGGGCPSVGQGAECLLIWILYDRLRRRSITEDWGARPEVKRWTDERRAASTAQGVIADPEWEQLFEDYKRALQPLRLTEPWDSSTSIAQHVAACQARLRAREQQLGYHGWQPARNEATFSLKGYVDDTFASSLTVSYRPLVEELLILRDQGRVRMQDKKLEARLPVDMPSLEIEVASSNAPICFGADSSAIDILGTDLDHNEGWLHNSPARLERADREVAAIVHSATRPQNSRALVDAKALLALLGFLFFLFDRACPGLRPWLNRPCRALRVTGGLRRGSKIFEKVPLPPTSQRHLTEVCGTLRNYNRAALQPRHGPLGDVVVVHHDAAGAPECGAIVFYGLNPEGLRGGGSWFQDPRKGTIGIMTKFPPEWLHGLSSTVSEYVVANAHLELVLEQTDAPTVLEVLDNLGTTQAIIGLRGHTPRMAACSLWRRDLMLRFQRRVVTVHRRRTANVPADLLSKGKWDGFCAAMAERGVAIPTSDPQTASASALARIRQVFELPAHDDDDELVDCGDVP